MTTTEARGTMTGLSAGRSTLASLAAVVAVAGNSNPNDTRCSVGRRSRRCLTSMLGFHEGVCRRGSRRRTRKILDRADRSLLVIVLTTMLGPTMAAARTVEVVVAAVTTAAVAAAAGGTPVLAFPAVQPVLAVSEGRCSMVGEGGIPQDQHVTFLSSSSHHQEGGNCSGFRSEHSRKTRSYCSYYCYTLVLDHKGLAHLPT